MPLAHLHILEGRSSDQKARLISDVTQAICHSLDTLPEQVRVLVHEIPTSNWGIGGVSIDKARRSSRS